MLLIFTIKIISLQELTGRIMRQIPASKPHTGHIKKRPVQVTTARRKVISTVMAETTKKGNRRARPTMRNNAREQQKGQHKGTSALTERTRHRRHYRGLRGSQQREPPEVDFITGGIRERLGPLRPQSS
jgi:hypothetical protein